MLLQSLIISSAWRSKRQRLVSEFCVWLTNNSEYSYDKSFKPKFSNSKNWPVTSLKEVCQRHIEHHIEVPGQLHFYTLWTIGNVMASILPLSTLLPNVGKHLKFYYALLISGVTISCNSSANRRNSWRLNHLLVHNTLTNLQASAVSTLQKTKKVGGFFFYLSIQSIAISHTWKRVYEAITWTQMVKKSEEKSTNISTTSQQLWKKILSRCLVYTW